MRHEDKNFSVLKNQFNITGSQGIKPDEQSIVSRCAAEIEIKPINWLWLNRFAKGKLSLIAGEPGLGKSQTIISMAANITTGKEWPDGATCNSGSVIFLSAEDDAENTIAPRLKAANADLTRVHIIDAVKIYDTNGREAFNQFSLESDLASLEKMIAELNNVVALFIDPISAYLGGRVDEHRNGAVRSILTPLAKLAEKHAISVICVTHLNKTSAQNAIHRIVGSIGFVAAARSAFVVIKDEDDENKRLFLPIKNNIGNDTTGLAFHIEPHDLGNGINISRISWSNETITKKANDLMGDQHAQDDKSAVDEAVDFLRDQLSKGPVFQKDIKQAAENQGIASKTLYRAKTKLKIISDKEKGRMDGNWFWMLES